MGKSSLSILFIIMVISNIIFIIPDSMLKFIFSLLLFLVVTSTQFGFDSGDPYCLKWVGIICIACSQGYLLDWSAICQQKTSNCTQTQFQFNGTCHDISPFCDQFDPNNGSCLSCILPEHVVLNGLCQELPPPPPECKTYEYLSASGTCKPVPYNCQNFNKVYQKCQECKWALRVNSEGGCSAIICPSGQDLSIDGKTCIPMPPNCAQYDSRLGKCTKCSFFGYEVHNGECRIGSEQKKQNCVVFNDLKNLCFQCQEGWRRDDVGVCSVISQK